jgi:hypothetical protein
MRLRTEIEVSRRVSRLNGVNKSMMRMKSVLIAPAE